MESALMICGAVDGEGAGKEEEWKGSVETSA